VGPSSERVFTLIFLPRFFMTRARQLNQVISKPAMVSAAQAVDATQALNLNHSGRKKMHHKKLSPIV
jgi:hypothetical protein